MLNNKTYQIIKIDEDYFMTEDMAMYSGVVAKEGDYEIRFFKAEPQLHLIQDDPSSYNWNGGSMYGYKVLASSKKIGLSIIDKEAFKIPSTVGVEPKSVEIIHWLNEDASYQIKKESGYVKIINVNY